MMHGDHCQTSGKWYKRQECREFSTDGTAMGATIAHMYGTTSEREIEIIQEWEERRERMALLTGMEEEQADWDAE